LIPYLHTLAICIPVYNRNISALIYQLEAQLLSYSGRYEILAYDDGSSLQYKVENQKIKAHGLIYAEFNKNIGRASIRNILGLSAQSKYLLFLDNDNEIITSDFVKKYFDLIDQEEPALICGGVQYPKNSYTEKDKLHWKYGNQIISTISSKINPTFISFNFLIRQDIFLQFHFNSELKTYGHEDTLMGMQLQENGYKLRFVDNPVLHAELDSTPEYLKKNLSAVLNLALLYKNKAHHTLIEQSRLAQAYNRLKKWRLTGMFSLVYKLIEPSIIKNLNSNDPSLGFFKVFKLGNFIIEMRK